MSESSELMVSREQALAGLRVLVHVSRADGHIDPAERDALQPVFDHLELSTSEIEALLAEEDALRAALDAVTDPKVRRQVMLASYAVARADEVVTEGERRVIEAIREEWGLEPQRLTPWEAIKESWRRDFAPSLLKPIEDPVEREQRIDRIVRSRAFGLAILGLVPGSIVAEGLTAFMQVRLVSSIGHYYGHRSDSKIMRALFASLIGVIAANTAIFTLVRLVPGWGSAIGAAANFATTYALGEVAKRYFESGGKLDKEALKNAFREARRRGRELYSEEKKRVQASAERVRVDVGELERQLDAGEVSAEEVARRLREDLEND